MAGLPILIAAFSGRAASMAARRAGFAPLVADLFADDDTRAEAQAVRRVAGDLSAGFEADALLAALSEMAAGAASPPVGFVYGAGFEDRPALLARIAERWPILGNAPAVVERVKDPWVLARTLRELGVPHPEIRVALPLFRRWHHVMPGEIEQRARSSPLPWRERAARRKPSRVRGAISRQTPDSRQHRPPHPVALRAPALSLQGRGRLPADAAFREGLPRDSAWLIKRRGGAGGVHVNDQARRQDDYYLQRRVEGRAVSALFLASPSGARIVGFSEQWTAPAPGQPFRFGGAASPADLPDPQAAELTQAVAKLAQAFALRGLNSADFLVGPQGWWLIEINPRLGATLDLFDGPAGALFSAHLAAARGEPVPPLPAPAGARALQILYAPYAMLIPPEVDWPDWVADRPPAGARVPAHAPLCTILATAQAACEARRLCGLRSKQLLSSLSATRRKACFDSLLAHHCETGRATFRNDSWTYW